MRINNVTPQQQPRIHAPQNNNTQKPKAAQIFAQIQEQQKNGVLVTISKAGRIFHELQQKNKGIMWHNWQDPTQASSVAAAKDAHRCQTCENRRYIDQSNDPSVSFQSPTKLSPAEAAPAVAAHESEHIKNDRASAENAGREVVSQSVSLHTSICPECKRVYVAGGKAQTLSVPGERLRRTPLTWTGEMMRMLMK